MKLVTLLKIIIFKIKTKIIIFIININFKI